MPFLISDLVENRSLYLLVLNKSLFQFIKKKNFIDMTIPSFLIFIKYRSCKILIKNYFV